MKALPDRIPLMSEDFAGRVLGWFDMHGRHDLPWQHPREPYRVWLSEIMLQQTQVATVIPYFQRFLARFPDLRSLAEAPIDDVLAHWAGLGYYARARNLHRCAQALMAQHGGEFPRSSAAVMALPGIGRSTAGAILSQAFGDRHPILDGNVRRVFARHAAISGWPGEPAVQRQLWALAEARLPTDRLADYSQGLMDLGATLCTSRRPACERCPVAADCQARIQNTVTRYPAAKPRRERPRRRAHLLLLRNRAGELLLERRPPTGIWGGLWCPPLLAEELSPSDWVQSRQLRTDATTEMPVVHHAFTHFDLELLPLEMQVSMDSGLADPGHWRWVETAGLHQLGLPAPIAKLLKSRSPSRP
ncbi:MAG TPA: A/G-specific adenine glycosylase [Solimonas sp.]|nr:A/G-specific adenine glycosylase [Solimonas sp.]